MALKQVFCFSCKTPSVIHDRLAFREVCSNCRADLHCCLTCEFYDPNSYQECRETQVERVQDKDRANFCEYYAPKGSASGKAGPTAQDLRAAAEALFKKK